jgi:hypothetical protein
VIGGNRVSAVTCVFVSDYDDVDQCGVVYLVVS